MPAAPARHGLRVALVGECMVELQGTLFGNLRQTFGGDTLNTAVYLARCGAHRGVRVRYVTALGDDGLSDGLLERWQAEGISTDWVRRLPGRLPGLYLIEVDARGERRFSYWRDSAAARSYFDADATPLEAGLGEVDWLYLSGISLAILPPAGRERLFAVLQRLRAQGGRVAFDNNFRPRLWPDAATARACFERAYALADLALVTLDDEQALFDGIGPESVLARPCAEVVVKRGASATWARGADGRRIEVPTERVTPVDTTAAGDSFAAGHLAARLAGAALADAVAFGNRLAARVIQHRGALIPPEDMADLLHDQPAPRL